MIIVIEIEKPLLPRQKTGLSDQMSAECQQRMLFDWNQGPEFLIHNILRKVWIKLDNLYVELKSDQQKYSINMNESQNVVGAFSLYLQFNLLTGERWLRCWLFDSVSHKSFLGKEIIKSSWNVVTSTFPNFSESNFSSKYRKNCMLFSACRKCCCLCQNEFLSKLLGFS